MVWMLRLMISVQVLAVTLLLCLTYLDKQNGNHYAPMCSKRDNISGHHAQYSTSDLMRGIVSSRPVVNFYRLIHSLKRGYSLTHAMNLFKMLGFVKQDPGTQWDVLWAHESPFKSGNLMNKVHHNQKVSQVPGMQQITHKAKLTTEGGLKYVPKSFLIPQQKLNFLEEVKQNKDKHRLWMQKNIEHRGNQVKKLQELDLKKESIIQEYISNPYLAQGRKLSIGIYVIVTSIDPLRVYIIDTKYITRCSVKLYDPEDFTDPTTFITDGYGHSNGHHFRLELDKGKDQNTAKYKYKEATGANVVFAREGYDTCWIQSQLYDAVRDVFEQKWSSIKHDINPTKRDSFFCITRWDFVPDEDFNLHLLEANMSPNMPTAGSRFHAMFFTSTLYSLLRISGIEAIRKNNSTRPSYIIRDSDVMLNSIPSCYNSSNISCANTECSLCPQCMTQNQIEMLKSLVFEHLNSHGMKRVFHTQRMDDFSSSNTQRVSTNLGSSFDLYHDWLSHKCQLDMYWCY
ncbi:probable tubulin polyglutamylase ttll-15 [Amphiura filiformis]|uniref:probable tubulin polyglutamylase ttll-15 n=1 Tax=Amphiura filiformis TaxID=82378 RepID=UPI003B21FB48